MKNIALITKSTFRGIGQIMLQENAFSGLLLFVGICYGSVFMGLGALLAAFVGTVTAYALKFDNSQTAKGHYGFSAALVGAAAFFFLKPVWMIGLIVVAAAVGATVTQHFFIRKRIAAFTLPFVLITWMMLFGIKNFAPDLLAAPTIFDPAETYKYLFPLYGFGQVIFQAKLLSGVLFFIAVLVHSRVSAWFGFLGAVVGGLIAYVWAVDPAFIANGMWSYNAVLCAIVFAGKTSKNYLWALVSVVLSLVIQFILIKLEWTALTFPFVAACFTTLCLKAKYENRRLAA